MIDQRRRSQGYLNFLPANTARLPSSSSILRSWLYLARRSDRQGAPVLICPVPKPTTRSAMKLSSVSPDLCETITPHPFSLHLLAAWIDSVRLPIWLTLSSRELQAFLLKASSILSTLVTKRSSPTICCLAPTPLVMVTHPCQSSWSNGSSMETMGYLLTYFSQSALSSELLR